MLLKQYPQKNFNPAKRGKGKEEIPTAIDRSDL